MVSQAQLSRMEMALERARKLNDRAAVLNLESQIAKARVCTPPLTGEAQPESLSERMRRRTGE